MEADRSSADGRFAYVSNYRCGPGFGPEEARRVLADRPASDRSFVDRHPASTRSDQDRAYRVGPGAEEWWPSRASERVRPGEQLSAATSVSVVASGGAAARVRSSPHRPLPRGASPCRRRGTPRAEMGGSEIVRRPAAVAAAPVALADRARARGRWRSAPPAELPVRPRSTPRAGWPASTSTPAPSRRRPPARDRRARLASSPTRGRRHYVAPDRVGRAGAAACPASPSRRSAAPPRRACSAGCATPPRVAVVGGRPAGSSTDAVPAAASRTGICAPSVPSAAIHRPRSDSGAAPFALSVHTTARDRRPWPRRPAADHQRAVRHRHRGLIDPS